MQGFDPSYQFFPHTYLPKEAEITNPENFLGSMGALINPTQQLNQDQLAQAAATTAKLKLEGLRPDMVQKVIDQKEALEQWQLNALQYNADGTPKKGMSRLKLNDAQQLELKSKRDALMESANTNKWVGDRLTQAESMALVAAKSGNLSQEDYAKWDKEVHEGIKKADSPGKYPDPVGLLNTYIEQRAQQKKDTDYKAWKSDLFGSMDKYGKWDDKVGFETNLKRVNYYGGPKYAERILGQPEGTYNSNEEAAGALTLAGKDMYKVKSRGATTFNFTPGSGQPGSIPSNPEPDGTVWWGTSQLPGNLRKWSGTIQSKGKSRAVSDADVTKVIKRGDKYFYEINYTVKTEDGNIEKTTEVPDDGTLVSVAKKNKYNFEGYGYEPSSKKQNTAAPKKWKFAK